MKGKFCANLKKKKICFLHTSHSNNFTSSNIEICCTMIFYWTEGIWWTSQNLLTNKFQELQMYIVVNLKIITVMLYVKVFYGNKTESSIKESKLILRFCRYLIGKGAIVDKFGGDLDSTPLHWATRLVENTCLYIYHIYTFILSVSRLQMPTYKQCPENSPFCPSVYLPICLSSQLSSRGKN